MKQAIPADQGLYSGLIRLHVLQYACEGPIFGLGMIEELARHGYRLSPAHYIPSCMGWRKRGGFNGFTQNNNRSTARSDAFIPQLLAAIKPFEPQNRKFVNYLANCLRRDDLRPNL
jgi:hypothetical protein